MTDEQFGYIKRVATSITVLLCAIIGLLCAMLGTARGTALGGRPL